MNENSIFGKLNSFKTAEEEVIQTKKENILSEVREDMSKLEEQKTQYLQLIEDIKAKRAELAGNRVKFKNALENLLPLFEDEEKKKLLAERGVSNISEMQENFSDTDEVFDMSSSEELVHQNIEDLKKMKNELIQTLNIENPDYQNLRGVSTILHWRVDSIDRDLFELSVDTPEGRENWPVRYPTGIYHKETVFEKNIKESKEPKLREIYHKLGDMIDGAFLEAFYEYNNSDTTDKIEHGEGYKEGRHIIGRSSVAIEDNKIEFYFGAGYSDLKYFISQGRDGNGLYFSRDHNFKALLPEKFLQIFNKKLSDIDNKAELMIGELK